MATTRTNGRLSGRIALITGGSRGIGADIVRAFAAEGADIAFSHLHDKAEAEVTAREVEALGGKVFHNECDVANIEAGRHFVARAAGTLGPIDILVNNAEIESPCFFENMKVAEFDSMIGIHLRGAFFITQAVYPMMKERGWGRIINISSSLAQSGEAEKTHFCTAKAGLLGFTFALAREAAPHGVLVNAIGPGPIELALTENVAPTAVLMASDEATNVVGAFVMLNGG